MHEVEQFHVLKKMCEKTPAMPLAIAFERLAQMATEETGIVGEPYKGHPNDAKALGEWAHTQPKIMQYIPDKKINAIKKLRAMTWVGLKEAKDGIEYLSHEILGHPVPTFSNYVSKY